MNKFKSFYLGENYNKHMYKGIIGYFMRLCHKNMESSKIKKPKVLEIGPGSHPHINYLNHEFDHYYIAEVLGDLSSNYDDDKRIIFKNYDGKKLPFEDNFFDRIIISHCLEHILEPEKFILEMYSKLKKGGNLTISLPTDPGILWRFGKYVSANYLIKKNYDYSKLDYYYFTAKDHVNSIFSLIPIIKKNFENINFEKYEPFKVPFIDCNLFYIIDITK